MAGIHPFRALRYDLRQVSASQVVTQPYDKITPAMQERYYAASPYNLVRIILGRRLWPALAGRWSLPAGFRSLDLRLLPDLHCALGNQVRTPGIHRARPRGR